jgi:hypothetical protein
MRNGWALHNPSHCWPDWGWIEFTAAVIRSKSIGPSVDGHRGVAMAAHPFS